MLLLGLCSCLLIRKFTWSHCDQIYRLSVNKTERYILSSAIYVIKFFPILSSAMIMIINVACWLGNLHDHVDGNVCCLDK